jgi:hypothetical protein
METQGQSVEDNVEETVELYTYDDNANRKRGRGESGTPPASSGVFICVKANSSSSIWEWG